MNSLMIAVNDSKLAELGVFLHDLTFADIDQFVEVNCRMNKKERKLQGQDIFKDKDFLLMQGRLLFYFKGFSTYPCNLHTVPYYYLLTKIYNDHFNSRKGYVCNIKLDLIKTGLYNTRKL